MALPETAAMTECLRDLGEAELIRRLSRFAPPGQFDDDTAAVQGGNDTLLINTDLLVEGVHFSDTTTSPQDVGWRAAAANLSDLAASGVTEPVGLTVGLVAPAHTPWRWVEGVYEGLSAALRRHGGFLLGGDCTGGQQRMLAITALGHCGPLRLHRNQAQAGDWLVVSGPHGLSRLGLALLRGEVDLRHHSVDRHLHAAAILQHQRPQPRFAALRDLLACKPLDLPWRAAGTDSSDGLLRSVQDLCHSSGCSAELDPTTLPLAPGWPQELNRESWCLNGGEDFELVLSLPPEWAKPWIAQAPGRQRIGRITTNANAGVHWSDGRGSVSAGGEFQHFQA
jgi:thiamine-monophosphate kinase